MSRCLTLRGVLGGQLREFNLELRQIYQQTIDNLDDQTLAVADRIRLAKSTCRARKEEQMAEIYSIITIAVGTPPQPDAPFTFEYYDKAGKFGTMSVTPLDFYHKMAAPFNAEESVSLINDPRNK